MVMLIPSTDSHSLLHPKIHTEKYKLLFHFRQTKNGHLHLSLYNTMYNIIIDLKVEVSLRCVLKRHDKKAFELDFSYI